MMIDRATLHTIAIVILVIAFLSTLAILYFDYKYLKGSLVTKGTMTGISTTRSLGDVSHTASGDGSHTMIVHFVTAQGEEVEAFMPVASDMKYGGEIEIRYLVSNPKRAMKNTFIQTWIRSFLLAFITLFLSFFYLVAFRM